MVDESSSASARTFSLVMLATIAGVVALYAASDFLMPIVFAGVLSVLLRPVVRLLKRLHLPASIAAALVALGLLATIAVAGITLAAPARGWLARTPLDLEAAGARLARLGQPVQHLSEMAGKVERAAQGSATQPATAPANNASASAPPNTMLARIAGSTSQAVGTVVEIVLLLYLMLASDGLFLRKAQGLLGTPEARQAAVDVLHESEAVVLRYVLVTAAINLGQSVVIALTMWWLGMPAPLIWGVFTFVVEFVPYLGAMVMIVLLAATALASFDNLGHILAVPGAYLFVSGVQNNLISPLAYGRGLKLNPVAVLIGVIFWWFVWGIPGAFLAVPLLAIMKSLGDHLRPLRAVSEFLGD